MGIKHVKGVLLYGPPSTDKTEYELKVINRPDVLNQQVRETE